MARHMPVSHTAAVILTAHSPSFTAPIVFVTSFSDQAMVSQVSVSTRWGPMLTSVVNESTSAVFSSPV